jgi:hypothetical protein
MAVIHNTTMVPTKLELLTSWLPAQPWYRQTGHAPELARSGGFRLDDPEGDVGIEFMVVTDSSGNDSTAYLIPLTYRAAGLADADHALIGTSEHGVLGQRWIYDGVHDPVLRAQLFALVQGQAEAQAQNVSHTADPTVTGRPAADRAVTLARSSVAADGPAGTDLRLETVDAGDGQAGEFILRINRVLQPGHSAGVNHRAGPPCLSGPWRLADGTHVGSVLATTRSSRA